MLIARRALSGRSRLANHRSESRITRSDRSDASPNRSASGTNSFGPIAPRVGCVQRASASNPTTAPSAHFTFGWKTTDISSLITALRKFAWNSAPRHACCTEELIGWATAPLARSNARRRSSLVYGLLSTPAISSPFASANRRAASITRPPIPLVTITAAVLPSRARWERTSRPSIFSMTRSTTTNVGDHSRWTRRNSSGSSVRRASRPVAPIWVLSSVPTAGSSSMIRTRSA